MEELQIAIHLPSCEDNKFSGKDFIDALTQKIQDFNLKFYFESNPSDAYYPYGYTKLFSMNLEQTEREKIILIIEDTFRALVKNNKATN